MKRSSQEKVKNAPLKSEATKLKDMQKAYGVSSKDSPSKTKSTPSTKSVLKSSGTTGESNALRTRNSTGSTNSSTKPEKMSSSRRSTETTNSKPSSKLVAASKANYAEKFGGSKNTLEHKNKTNAGVAGVSNHTTTSSNRRTSNNTSVTTTSGSGNNNSPYKMKSSQKTNASTKSSSSTTSRLTTQKPPTNLYDESEVASNPAPEDNYDEDFEEDYESDFEEEEEAMSSAGEEEPEQNGGLILTKELEVDASSVIEDDDYDKSSSIREFEKLEKLVEVEDKQILQAPEAPQQKRSNTKPSALTREEDFGSGEPASGTILGLRSTKVDESEEEEDDDEDEEPLAHVKKQSVFPTSTGFSINTSTPSQREQFGGNRVDSALVARKSTGGLGAVVKTSDHGPLGESSKQRVKRASRGKIIQGMIKLDRVQVDIFHLAPYQYERFMTVFSGTNRLQASTQTDQDQSEESAQTETIEQTAKWTQKPPTWSTTSSSCDIRIVRQEALGVGSDEISEDLSSDDQKIYKQFDFLKNWEQFSQFILRASRKILYVLETEERLKLPSGAKGALDKIKMNRGLSVLSKLSMHTLACDGEFVGCANEPKLDVQAHDTTVNGNKKHTSKNLVTVWSLKEPSMPLYFLRVWGHVSTLKLHMIGRMVVSGNRDGSLNVWNLDESMCYHSQYQEQVIRTPSVNTSCMMPTHILPVVGIEMLSESKNTFSIITIDKEGLLITWSCHRSHDTLRESALSQHSSVWSTVHLSARYQIQLVDITRDHLQITCFSSVWDVDATTTRFYFGTFNGYVAKGKIVVEGPSSTTTTIDKYQERMDSNPKVTSIDISKTLNILAMGCEDGRCRLFELSRKKMVLSLGEKEEPVRVRWSARRATILYVALKDSLVIWDLLTNDRFPWKELHFRDIQDFVLYSPPHKEYIVIISEKDLIISTPPEEVKPLTNRELTKVQNYFAVLC